MKRNYFLLFSACLICIVCLIVEAYEEELPPGMEIIEIGDVKHLVPIGTKVRKESGLMVLEGQSEYMARKFISIEQRIEQIEKDLEALRKAVGEIKKEQPS